MREHDGFCRAARMCRVEAIVLDRDLHRVVIELGRWGHAQFIRTEPGPDSAPLPPRDNRQRMQDCAALLERVARLRSQLSLCANPDSEPCSRAPSELELELRHWEEQASPLLAEHDRLTALRDRLATESHGTPSLPAGLDPSRIASSDYLHFALGSIPAQQDYGPALPEAVVIVPLGEADGRLRILAAASRSRGGELDQCLGAIGFRRDGESVAGASKVDDAELQRVRDQLREVASRCAPSLDAIEARARLDRTLLEAESVFCRTASTTQIRAWVPEQLVDDFSRVLSRSTQGCFLLSRLEPTDGEDAPVLLSHGPWVRPYSVLVEAYGTPLYTEVEPTIFMAISYVLMFGVMFGDVGHGLLLLGAGLAARRFCRGVIKEAGPVLVAAGLSSSFFGALYGSFFGIHGLQKYALWRDPIAGNPAHIMLACIGFGVCLISLGIVLNVVNLARRGDWTGALLDKFGVSGLLFYWSALGLLAGFDAIADRGLLPVAVSALVLPVAAWTCREPIAWLKARRNHGASHSSLGAAFGESAAEAFEGLLVYLASTISFVRLAAYAMSHAALLLAVFMVAAEVRTIPGGATAVVVLGNAVVIVLEATIAAVQALRLEYYEFFGKFFSGSGRPFTPFQLPSHGRLAAHAQRS